METML